VELRFSGDQLEPSEISARLNLQPSKVSRRSPFLPIREQRRRYWGYNGKGEIGYQFGWEFLGDGLEFLIKILNSRKTEVIAIGRQFDGHWWCGHFRIHADGGPKLSAQLLTEIGSYGMPLCIDNCPDGD